MIKKKKNKNKNKLQKQDEEFQTISFKDGWDRIFALGIQPFWNRINLYKDGVADETCSCYRCMGDSYIRTYDTIFTMCIQREPYNYSAQIYDKLIQQHNIYFSNNWVSDLKSLKQKQNIIQFLKLWCKTWKWAKIEVDGMTRMFMYLDRFHVPNNNLLNTSTCGYISFYCNIFQLFSIYAKYGILRLIQRKRKQPIINYYDQIITDSIKVFIEIDRKFTKQKVKLTDLPSNKLNIVNMSVVIDGYIHKMEPEILVPLEIIAICKMYFGNIDGVHLLQQCFLTDFMKHTKNYYRWQSLNWLKFGVRCYFMYCDKAIIDEMDILSTCMLSKNINQMTMDMYYIFFRDMSRINKLFEGMTVEDIPFLFDIFLKLNHYLVGEELLNNIIKILSDSFDSDIKLLIDKFIDREIGIKTNTNIYSLKRFMHSIFHDNTNKIAAFMVCIYYHGKYMKEHIGFEIEKGRKYYIQNRLNEIIYSFS